MNAIGDMQIPCAVLDDGKRSRVLSRRGFYSALGASQLSGRRPNDDGNEGDGLPSFLSSQALRPYLSPELATTVSKPLVYRTVGTGRSRGGGTAAYGIPATLIPDLCDVWLKARAAGSLHYKQEHIAAKAELLVRGLARVGIIALVDEATGYQADRDRDELSRILEAYINEELRPWLQHFPHEFFKQVHRLWGWPYKEGSTQGPRYVGKIITNYIYKRLPPGVHDELQKKNPSANGRRRHAHHQWLTEDTGIAHLDKQITAVTTLMAVSDDKATLDALIKKRFPKQWDQIPLLQPQLVEAGAGEEE